MEGYSGMLWQVETWEARGRGVQKKNAYLTCLTGSKATAIRTKGRDELWKPRREGLERGRAAGLKVMEGLKRGR